MVLADMTVEKSRTVLGREIPWTDLEREARRELKGRVERFVEARYRGQSHEIRIPVGADFHEAHRRLYGFTRREPVEIVNAVVRVTSEQPKPRREKAARASAVLGPAVIPEATATTWVPKGWTARPDEYGNIVICQ
jgi:N-methylhydantoinase A/oxoprolinase/acetone carboxylase beta subunit